MTALPTILFIDDDPELGATLVRFVERAFSTYQVLWARDGAAGVDLARQHVDHLRLVVLDIDMPRMDGNLAAVQIRALAPHVPIMPFSSHNQSFQALLDLGCVLPILKQPEVFRQMPMLMRQAMAAKVVPMPDLPWIAAMRQSGTMTLSHAPDENPAARGALRWLDKYCGRQAFISREITNARKLLQEATAR